MMPRCIYDKQVVNNISQLGNSGVKWKCWCCRKIFSVAFFLLTIDKLYELNVKNGINHKPYEEEENTGKYYQGKSQHRINMIICKLRINIKKKKIPVNPIKEKLKIESNWSHLSHLQAVNVNKEEEGSRKPDQWKTQPRINPITFQSFASCQ